MEILKFLYEYAKFIALIVGAVYVFILLAGLVMCWRIPVGADIKATNAIRGEFTRAMETNFTRQIKVIVTPSRNKTIVIVKTPVSEAEKAKINGLARETSLMHSNWVVQMDYEHPDK